MTPPPRLIDGAAVLWWADTAGLIKSDTCTFREGNRVQSSFAGLAIAQYEGTQDCYLFLCDEHWETQNDTDHSSVDEAKKFAESIYPGISGRWRRAAG